MIDTIIFDLDGTLLDTLADITDSINYMLALNSLTPKTEKEVRGFLGGGVIKLIESVVPEIKDKEKFLKALNTYKDHYTRNQFNKTQPYPGIIEMLTRVKNMKINTAVVSNKGEKSVIALTKKYFDGLITTAIGDDFMRPLKPDPAPVKYALARLDSVRANAVLVGDSEIDIKAAKNCGIRCVGVTWGYRDREILIDSHADIIIDNPEQLLDYLSDTSEKKIE